VGGLLGYGPFPDEVVQRLRKAGFLCTLGDYDSRVLRFKKRKDKWRRKLRPERYLAYEWAYEQLSKKNRKYLRFLSAELRTSVKGHRILLTHTCPGLGKRDLRPDSPEEDLVPLAKKVQAGIVACGHAHEPFARQVAGVWFVNPGSVGRPTDGDPRAGYAILQIDRDEIEVRHHRIDYDLEPLLAALREQDLPDSFARMFLEGRDLKTILAESDD
jgi:predicted phosphodiesterase